MVSRKTHNDLADSNIPTQLTLLSEGPTSPPPANGQPSFIYIDQDDILNLKNRIRPRKSSADFVLTISPLL